MKASDVYAWCDRCDSRVYLDGEVAVAVNAHDELVAALEASNERMHGLHDGGECNGCALGSQVAVNDTLLARIKGEASDALD